jgi:hypothetical protein
VILTCPRGIVETSLASLRKAGAKEQEGIILWLAGRANPQLIVEAYVPQHVAEIDRFWISCEAMIGMLNHLRTTRKSVAAQVHSHPNLAFHSWADDEYAIPRHAGALSIVVPFFGTRTTVVDFQQSSAFFALSPEGKWQPVDAPDIRDLFEIQG